MQTEIPNEMSALYRHLDSYTTLPETIADPEKIFSDPSLFNEMRAFVHERITIWKKKTSGEKPPFTSDPILAAYRFCNIYREFDRQTIEYHTLLAPMQGDLALWLLNMFYCRVVARPETIRNVGLLSFDIRQNQKVCERLKLHPSPRYGTPYVFPINVIQGGKNPYARETFVTQYLPMVTRDIANEIRRWDKLSIHDAVARVIPIFRYELRFHWTEVLIDTAYQYPKHLDLFKRFPVGPGASPTMERIRPDTDPTLLAVELSQLPFDTGLSHKGLPMRLSAENWEGIACEFRKYTNLKSGAGRRRVFTKKKVETKTDSLF